MLDRRLMQDDERGLGQGVKDNKVTRETFRLLLERRLDTTSVSGRGGGGGGCNTEYITL